LTTFSVRERSKVRRVSVRPFICRLELKLEAELLWAAPMPAVRALCVSVAD
jgi:hypothetical protein